MTRSSSTSPGLFASRDVTAGMPVNSDDGSRLGYVVLVYDANTFYGRVRSTLLKLAVATVPALLLLIPLGWVWGDRMAKPLLRLAAAMARVGKEHPEKVGAGITAQSNDEIGQLEQQFRTMLAELAQKQDLEREVVVSERLAAVGGRSRHRTRNQQSARRHAERYRYAQHSR